MSKKSRVYSRSAYDPVRRAFEKMARQAGALVKSVPRKEHGHSRLRHRALFVNGKLVLIHHLTNYFQRRKHGVVYARTLIRRNILEKSSKTVIHLAVPGFPERTITFSSQRLLQRVFGDNNRAEKTLYVPL